MYVLPAEWEKQAAVWLIWPVNITDWPSKFQPIPWVFAEMVRILGRGQLVRLVVKDESEAVRVGRLLHRAGAELERVEFVFGPSNRSWARDCLPVFVRDGKKIKALDFKFNAWAKYDDFELDDGLGKIVAEAAGLERLEPEFVGKRVVLEGGAIDVNGQGTLLTTEECLLDAKIQCRNPGLGRKNYEAVFERYLGVRQVVWLGKGIAGDDTHGHVDDLCRFVGPSSVVLCEEKNERDGNYVILMENRERLQGVRLENGERLEVVALPMPGPVYFEGRRLPASYANFLIGNEVVLVPTFNDPKDRLALGILAELMPQKEVVGLHALDLIWGLGAAHCLTHEEPLAVY